MSEKDVQENTPRFVDLAMDQNAVGIKELLESQMALRTTHVIEAKKTELAAVLLEGETVSEEQIDEKYSTSPFSLTKHQNISVMKSASKQGYDPYNSHDVQKKIAKQRLSQKTQRVSDRIHKFVAKMKGKQAE